MWRPWLESGVRVSAFAFHKDYFEIDYWHFYASSNIRSGKLYIKYDGNAVKIFQKNSLFHLEMILRLLFCFKGTKNTG